MVVFPFPGMRERGQLRMAYKFGWNGRTKAIANLYKSNKRRRETNKEEIGEKKKKKTMRMKRSKDIINLLDDDILVHEILSRLPGKSLMRFKSVCKRWMSLIQHDSHFHDLHFTQSEKHPCLLYLLPLASYRRLYGLRECFFSADLGEGRASVSNIGRTRSLAYNGILKPVNGLICFFSKKEHYVGVCIYNPGTREITPWIYSTLVMEYKKEINKRPTYGFGFDPTTKEHKVICVWRNYDPTPLIACEILTVGPNKWRRIDEVPPYEFEEDSVYVNGSIYWRNKSWLGDLYKKNDDPEVIIAFDVGSEKFRTIPIPNFILNQPCDCKQYCGPHVDLLKVDGRVALLRRMDGYTVKLWIFFDDHNYDKKENITTTTWTEETIKLPFCWDTNVEKLSFHGVAGTNQLILQSVEFQCLGGRTRWPVSLYSYNRKNQSFKKVEISGISSISDPTYSLFTPFVESLLPVSSSGTPTLRLDLGSESIQELRGPVSPGFP